MAAKILGPTGSRRRRFLWIPLLLVAASALFLVGGAQAVHDTGAFELDGNATNNPAVLGDDWDNVCHQVLHSDCSTSSDTTGAKAASWVAEPNTNATIFTGGGSKDPQDISNWQWKDGAGGLPDKDNLLHSFAARYTTNQGDVLFFGSDRLDNSGDAQQGFWFFQNPIALGSSGHFSGVHKAGDLLVISDFSNGGTTSTITVYSWDPTCLKTGGTCGDANLRTLASSTSANCATAGANDAFCGIVNGGTITLPWSFTDKSGTTNNQALNGEFYEGGVNLTSLGLAGECFSTVASETRSSTSTTATLKDFILGNFGSCASTTTSAQTWLPNDSGTVSVENASSWTGNLSFTLYDNATCDGNVLYSSPTNAVSNSSPTASTNNTTTSVTATGSTSWLVTFTTTTPGVTGSSHCESTDLTITN
jgi:hypothetical protein